MSFSRVSVCLFVLLFCFLPGCLSWCGFNQFDVWYGNLTHSGNTCYLGNSRSTNGQYWSGSAVVDQGGSSYTSPSVEVTLTDTTASCNCSSYVVLRFTTETNKNKVYVQMDGWTLQLVPQPYPYQSYSPTINWVSGLAITSGSVLLPTQTYAPYVGSSQSFSFMQGVNSLVPNQGSYCPSYWYIPFPHYNCTSGAKNVFNIGVYHVSDSCHGFCQVPITKYTNSCTIIPPPPPPAIHGDPEFTGLRGQNYQIHGIDGAVYNIISDQYMQLNSRFIYLNGPRACPLIPTTSKKSVACWSHPGSYLGDIGLKTNLADRLYVASGPAADGFSIVELNGQALNISSTYELTLVSQGPDQQQGLITYLSSHEVVLKVGLFEIELENSDGFINLRSVLVRGKNWQKLVDEKAHGLLGQTWQLRKGKGINAVIEGRVDDYMILDDEVFGEQFLYNKFKVIGSAE